MLNRLGKNQSSGMVYGLTAESLGMDILLILCGALGRPIIMQIRRIKRDDQDIIKERFAEAVLNDNNRDFWSETKRMRGKTMVSSNVVDGHCTAESIADSLPVDKKIYIAA